MGIAYRAEVEILGLVKGDEDLASSIKNAVDCAQFLGKADWSCSSGIYLFGTIETSVWAGNTTEAIAEELRDAIWKAAGKFLEISVDFYCLEVDPDESNDFSDEDDYLEWLGGLKALATAADSE